MSLRAFIYKTASDNRFVQFALNIILFPALMKLFPVHCVMYLLYCFDTGGGGGGGVFINISSKSTF